MVGAKAEIPQPNSTHGTIVRLTAMSETPILILSGIMSSQALRNRDRPHATRKGHPRVSDFPARTSGVRRSVYPDKGRAVILAFVSGEAQHVAATLSKFKTRLARKTARPLVYSRFHIEEYRRWIDAAVAGSRISHPEDRRLVVEAIGNITGAQFETLYKLGRAIDVPRSVLDCTRARTDFGWRSRSPLAEGLRNTWNWLLAEKKWRPPRKLRLKMRSADSG